MRAVKTQRTLRDVFKGSVAVVGVTAGLFSLWLASATKDNGDGTTALLLENFVQVLSCVFDVAIAVAAVSFACLKS
ncbi:MAG: hypothetical protein ABIS84_12860 [Arachnia sp.]